MRLCADEAILSVMAYGEKIAASLSLLAMTPIKFHAHTHPRHCEDAPLAQTKQSFLSWHSGKRLPRRGVYTERSECAPRNDRGKGLFYTFAFCLYPFAFTLHPSLHHAHHSCRFLASGRKPVKIIPLRQPRCAYPNRIFVPIRRFTAEKRADEPPKRVIEFQRHLVAN